MSRFHNARSWITSTPLRLALIAGVLVVALGAGVAFATAVNGVREREGTAQAPSATASISRPLPRRHRRRGRRPRRVVTDADPIRNGGDCACRSKRNCGSSAACTERDGEGRSCRVAVPRSASPSSFLPPQSRSTPWASSRKES